jgi:multidrug efflux pump subunit AcrA (membrane-fusion protein)
MAIVLPRSALFRWDNAPAVWKVDPNTNAVEPHVVTIDRFGDTEIVVASGVETGDIVVTAGIQFLYPGEIVETAQAGPHS